MCFSQHPFFKCGACLLTTPFLKYRACHLTTTPFERVFVAQTSLVQILCQYYLPLKKVFFHLQFSGCSYDNGGPVLFCFVFFVIIFSIKLLPFFFLLFVLFICFLTRCELVFQISIYTQITSARTPNLLASVNVKVTSYEKLGMSKVTSDIQNNAQNKT